MNANEVISKSRPSSGGEMGSKKPSIPTTTLHYEPTSNDSFPTAIHIATAVEAVHRFLSGAGNIRPTRSRSREEAFKDIKIGRTHTQDATPVTLGQEFSGYRAALEYARHRIGGGDVFLLAQGGTAVGRADAPPA